jgi:hypothetical protein
MGLPKRAWQETKSKKSAPILDFPPRPFTEAARLRRRIVGS